MTFELVDPPIIATTMFREVRGLGTGFPKLTLQLVNVSVISATVLCQVGRLRPRIFQLALKVGNFELAQSHVRIPVLHFVAFAAQLAFLGRGRSVAQTWAAAGRVRTSERSSPHSRAASGAVLEGIAGVGTACGGDTLGS